MKKLSFLYLPLCVLLSTFVLFGLTACLSAANSSKKPSSSSSQASPNISTELLKQSWQFYKTRFLADGSHVRSNAYGGTITEGQSYALQKAVWMDDPETFKRVWDWTKTQMRRPNDHLLGWRWNAPSLSRPFGSLDTDNATDADQDIAYALLLAGEKWHDAAYLSDAKNIISDLWRLNVETLGGQYYLLPGTWASFRHSGGSDDLMTLDPSYFAPYVYRKFATYDPPHALGWEALADQTYTTLEQCSNLTALKLPPNWCGIRWQPDPLSHGRHFQGHAVVFSDLQGPGSRDFSYDAFRVYWRMAMDARLSPSPGRDKAMAYLKNHRALLDYWQHHHSLPEGFTAEGTPREPLISTFAMGPLLITKYFQMQPASIGESATKNDSTNDDINKDGSSKKDPLKESPEINGKQKRAFDKENAFYQQSLGQYYHPEGYWQNDYNDFLHSVIWLHLYALR